ncbi:hypothetical protein BVY03_04140 [bacterium K02(2017)]|nr:hypothetical protein BVY03_04140 [bacterium K02(2017)]
MTQDLRTNLDIISCNSFEFECELGFHQFELGIKQKIKLDFDVLIEPIPSEYRDDMKYLKFDYFLANKIIQEYLIDRRYDLIEALAEDLAQLMLKSFKIKAVKMGVTKFPADMPNTQSITYTCFREK